MRVGLPDGSVIDGFLLSAASDHLSIRLPDARARYIPVDQICSVHLARRRPFRELVPVSGIIIGATTVLVGIGMLPALRPYLMRIAGVLAVLGFALVVHLVRRTALGDWLTSWKTLFDVRQP